MAVYVSPAGSATAHDWSCRTAAYSSVQAAVEAAPLHGTVVVCPGVYQQTVSVDRTVNLRGKRGAVINAAGQPYGVGVTVSWVTISGLTVENANATAAGSPDDGIITAGFVNGVPKPADHVTITGNIANDNGLGSPLAPDASAGSGIILADSGAKGGVYNTLVAGNTFAGNGHGGVAVHAHAPGLNFSGNVIAGNRIGRNNLRTDTDDLRTTGVYLADASPLTIKVVGNTIYGNYYGIFTAGKVTVKGAKFNRFIHVSHRFGGFPTYP